MMTNHWFRGFRQNWQVPKEVYTWLALSQDVDVVFLHFFAVNMYIYIYSHNICPYIRISIYPHTYIYIYTYTYIYIYYIHIDTQEYTNLSSFGFSHETCISQAQPGSQIRPVFWAGGLRTSWGWEPWGFGKGWWVVSVKQLGIHHP